MERDAYHLRSDPSQDVYSNAIIGLVCDSLYKIDDKGAGRRPAWSRRPTTRSPTSTCMTLRKGIKFQDGTDLNAEAVKFNLERHIERSPRASATRT